MRRRPLLLAALGGLASACSAEPGDAPPTGLRTVNLRPPGVGSTVTLDEALDRRQSVREFAARRVTRDELSRLLWAAQGITHGGGLRAAPSAGALYPLVVHAAGPEGLYRYDAVSAQALVTATRDVRSALGAAALGQSWVGTAPVVFAISADVSRTATRYAARAERYVLLEAGHVAQNLLLEAVALGLGGTPVGAFDDDEVARVLVLPSHERPVYLLPVGAPAGGR